MRFAYQVCWDTSISIKLSYLKKPVLFEDIQNVESKSLTFQQGRLKTRNKPGRMLSQRLAGKFSMIFFTNIPSPRCTVFIPNEVVPVFCMFTVNAFCCTP